jgi:uncharacterized protein Veg
MVDCTVLMLQVYVAVLTVYKMAKNGIKAKIEIKAEIGIKTEIGIKAEIGRKKKKQRINGRIPHICLFVFLFSYYYFLISFASFSKLLLSV